MLRWRLLLGTLIIAALVALCWLDHRSNYPGIWLALALTPFGLLAIQEILDLEYAAGLHPLPWTVSAGCILVFVSPWAETLVRRWQGIETTGWLAESFAFAVVLVFFGEMRRYEKPGAIMANIAGAVFAIAYVGLLLGFAVQLRLDWGVGALASLILVVKAGDTGAYTVGRLIGRHKMAPKLSPGKTIEGALGAFAFSLLAAWAAFPGMDSLNRSPGDDSSNIAPWWGWIVFGLFVGGVGMLGDLAESLLKRDAGRKDSSRWLPGFGGVLDILDSILLAAPVAYFCFQAGFVR